MRGGCARPASSTENPATQITFVPSNGVTTDTSPRLNARNVNTCPAKNAQAASAACPAPLALKGCVRITQHPWYPSAITMLLANATRHTPVPSASARLRKMVESA